MLFDCSIVFERDENNNSSPEEKHLVVLWGLRCMGCGDPCIIIPIRQEPPGKLNTGIT